MNKTCILIIFFLSCLCPETFSEKRVTSELYDIQNGLPQQTITSIIKDNTGYLWFSTIDGVCRFDGYEFTSFRPLPNDSSGIAANQIDKIRICSKGYYWITDNEGNLYRFYPDSNNYVNISKKIGHITKIFTLPDGDIWVCLKQGQLSRISPYDYGEIYSDINHENLSDCSIINISYDLEDVIIVHNKGVYKYEKKESKLSEILYTPDIELCCFRKNEVNYLIGASKGIVYSIDRKSGMARKVTISTRSKITRVKPYSTNAIIFATENDGIIFTDNNINELNRFNDTNLMLNNQAYGIYIDKKKDVWVTYRSSKMITKLNPKTNQSKHYNLGLQDRTLCQRSIYEDSNGLMWIVSKNETLNYYDANSDSFVPFYVEKINNRGGFTKVIRAYFDKQGVLWIARFPKGLIKVAFKDESFKLATPHFTNNTINNNDVRAIVEDENKRILAGTKDGNIQVYDNNMSFIGYIDLNGNISDTPHSFGAIYTMCFDKKHRIWIGTNGNGLYRLTGKDYGFKIDHFTSDGKYGLSSNYVHGISEDIYGKIWIATYGGGINYIDSDGPGKEIFINPYNMMNKYPSTYMKSRSISFDNYDNIWIATSSGILLYNKNNKPAFNEIKNNNSINNTLDCNNTFNVFTSSDNNTYVTSFGGGINKFEYYDQKLKNGIFTIPPGLDEISKVTYSIVEDEMNGLWISSEDGLYRYFNNSDSLELFDDRYMPNGLSFNNGKAIRRNNGDIAFPTDQGILWCSPQLISKKMDNSKIVINNISVHGKKIDNPDIHNITLSSSQNSFSINYTTLDLKFPNKTEYAYRLNGFDDWVYADNNRVAVYTNIPKGHYSFQVKSTNADGIWCNYSESIPITILPSFWESKTGIVLIIIIAITILALTFRTLLMVYKLKNKVVVENRIIDIKNKFFHDIIHELRSPFTLIAAPIENILSNKNIPSDIESDLRMVMSNTKRSLKIINKVLDLQKLRLNKEHLRVQVIDMNKFIYNIVTNFKSIALQRECEIYFKSNSENINIWSDPEKLESILYNLVSNAFKYSPKGSDISIELIDCLEHIEIIVSDHGYGIEQDKQSNIFERFESYVRSDIFKQESTGIGLSLVKELVELHKGNIILDSVVNEGTSFKVILKKGIDHFNKDTEFIANINESEFAVYNNISDDYIQDNDVNTDNKLSLLVIDDDKELLKFLVEILSEEYHIITAVNGEIGYSKAEKYQPSMIISDYCMPVMSGTELIKKLHENKLTSHIPIVFLSGHEDIDKLNEGLELGICDYITKPFSTSFLKLKLRNILNQQKLLQAAFFHNIIYSNDNLESDSMSISFPESDKNLLNKMVRYIDKNIDNCNLSVDSLVIEVGISRSALYRKTKSLIGISPMELIKNIRMRKAVELIKIGSDNFSQIADKTGFNDSQYFSKCFKQTYGMTPSEYKKVVRKDINQDIKEYLPEFLILEAD